MITSHYISVVEFEKKYGKISHKIRETEDHVPGYCILGENSPNNIIWGKKSEIIEISVVTPDDMYPEAKKGTYLNFVQPLD